MRPPILHRLRRLFSSIAILAVLLNAFMPTLSKAMAGQADVGSGWTELCTVQGTRWVKLDAKGTIQAQSDQQQRDTTAALHGAACDYCLTHAASFGLPPSSAWTPALAEPELALSKESASAPRRAGYSWASPAVRAPPLRS